jgi:transposase
VHYQLETRRHPEHGFRACFGLLGLTKKYGNDRLEAACRRAQHIGAMNYKSVASILSNSLDKLPLDGTETTTQTKLPLDHDNVRGAGYYH